MTGLVPVIRHERSGRDATEPNPTHPLLDLRTNQAREALADYTAWQVTGSPQDAPVLLGRLAGTLELVLTALREAGL